MCALIFLVLFALGFNQSFAQGEYSCLSDADHPTGATVRRTNTFESDGNRVPLYLLTIGEFESDIDHGRRYDVYVAALSQTKYIKTVTITAKGYPECGNGQFTFYRGEFYTTPVCPSMLESTNNELLNLSKTLHWTPPPCGCVNLRVTVVDSSKQYYRDEKSLENGPLSRRICVKNQSDRLQFLKALCYATENVSPEDVIDKPYFLARHNLKAKTMQRNKLLDALQSRWDQIRTCCAKCTDGELVGCMDTIRRRSINSLCTHNSTAIPFSHYKAGHMLGRQKQCCRLRGELRYICFGERKTLVKATKDAYLDFSKDETDPANDVAIFKPTQEEGVMKYVTLVEVQNKTTSLDTYVEVSITTNAIPISSKERLKVERRCCRAAEESVLNITTMETDFIIAECELTSRKYTSSREDIKGNLNKEKFCIDKYVNCCIKNWCCTKGNIYGAAMARRQPKNPLKECKKKYKQNVKSKTKLKVCKRRFGECCYAKNVDSEGTRHT